MNTDFNINLAVAYPMLIGDIMQHTLNDSTLPPLIVRRWTESVRANTRAGWRAMAELCGRTAIGIFCENDYDPENSDFKAICKLARTAHMRSVECLTRPYRECGALA